MSRLLNPRRFNAEKFAWQHQVLTDPELSAFSKVLGAFLTHYLDPQKGGSWASQQFLATHLGVDIRTIRRATRELVAKGHIALEVSRGRGNANVCRALLKGATGASTVPAATTPQEISGHEYMADHRTRSSGDQAQNRTNRARKPDSTARPILPESESPLVPPISRRRSPACPAPSNRGKSPKLLQYPSASSRPASATPARVTPQFPNAEVRAAVVCAMGESAAKSYLDPAVWCETDRTIICRLGIAADTLRTRIPGELRALGVRVLVDRSSQSVDGPIVRHAA
ncbi:helix-turn-helix domain-containing protein [Phenylobacterium sp.]|uniref:helix-turn-helix domain-containing protein n=1 Tax=Phenylobacterium sp. TaxID=1871053 RepID=UPI0035B1EA65